MLPTIKICSEYLKVNQLAKQLVYVDLRIYKEFKLKNRYYERPLPK